MRQLNHYAVSEWLTGVPLAHRLRRARNVVVDRIYRDRKAPGQEELVQRLRQHREGLAFTVAFNMPEAISLLIAAMGRFTPDMPLVVCDNSSDPEARVRNAAICAAHQGPPFIAYCDLPPVPFKGGRNGSRSHAVALNWIFHNLVRPVAPRVFALLDHDLVPLERVDLRALVADRPCYGMVRSEGDAWYLWPGYCVFNFEKVGHLPLDFGTDTPLGLDTGGQNWSVLYRHLDRAACSALIRPMRVPDPLHGLSDHYLMVDSWLHAGGAGHGGELAFAAVRRAYENDPEGLLANLVDAR
ncbi:hypothetical protein ACT6QG_03900 [Xanthobacter sp. TB0136]|uniref:hypothetical protein n=1 Tax=Xanthobacter sp. TB0136 TaxID=3459177 RepID=UPI0040391588